MLGGVANDRVLVGIGDDAAVLAPNREPLVWTVDAAVEGVHFRRDLLSFEDLGFRATMAAASDLAAMGAEPVALLAALVLPGDVTDADLRALAEGQRAASAALGAPVVGGNLARGSELSITTTAIGAARQPLRRDGARPGDVLGLAGPVGLAAAGFRLLDKRGPIDGEAAARAVQAWRRPTARTADGLRARSAATSAIDISDGLARDLGHIAHASGVSAVLDPAALITPELIEAASLTGADPLELALHGGEDYALVITAPPGSLPEGFTPIGRCDASGEDAPGVALLDNSGLARRIDERGFDHFAAPRP